MSRFATFIGLFAFIGLISYSDGLGNGPQHYDWEAYKAHHHKRYDPLMENEHKRNYDANFAKIKAYRQKYEAGKVGYLLELNEFSDQEPSAFVRARNGYKKSSLSAAGPVAPISSSGSGSANTTGESGVILDWRKSSMVSPVKDQQQCGSCYTFSATGALESQVLIKDISKQLFSEMQLVDCDTNDDGCNGGDYNNAWNYLIDIGGIQNEASYPYTAGAGPYPGPYTGVTSCTFNPSSVVQTVTGTQQVAGDPASIKQALSSIGPLSIAVDASEWQSYSTGIFSCTTTALDHAVLLIGYGVDTSGTPYWIVKNSWGTGWGDAGYILVNATPGLDCGITQEVSYPLI